jgi:malonate-semialdehyde dehydrogenase (acetylating)/methylmalonate-semialdehyde dehydrogenase
MGRVHEMTTITEARTLRNYIGGGWVEAAAGDTLEDRDPASGELAALIPLSGADDVDAAVRAAREAQPAWRDVAPQKRARAVMALREALWERREDIARLVTADMGKTLDDARGEVLRGIESTEAACGIPHLLKGENLEGVARGVDVELVRQPVGVVGAITPFNFPAMIPLWFLPYAIACGNSFILKPSERDPRPSELIFEIVDRIEEIPPGVLNLVHGARDAVNGLLDHPGIDAISFVGQASTARYIAERSAAHGKRFQALGGAKNSLVVMPDANLGVTVPAIMSSAFGAGGQRCLAGSVAVLVGTREEQDRALDALTEAAAELGVGPGDQEGVEVCPLVAPEARDRIAAAVESAESGGDEVILDGRRDAGPGGTLIGPSIVATADTESDLAREELFGPLLTVVRTDDLDAALQFVPVAWFPFSGWKDSLDGDLHANGRDAVEFYTRKKVVTSRW